MNEKNLTVNEVLKKIMKKNGVKTSELARRLKVSNRVITDRLRSRSPTIRTASEIAEALGYQFVIMPDYCETPPNSYKVSVKKGGKTKK